MPARRSSPAVPFTPPHPSCHMDTQRLSPRRKTFPLDRELPDLGVKVPDLRLVLQGGLVARAPGKHLRQPFKQPPLPCGHLVRIKLVPRGDRLHAVPLAQGLQALPAP